MEGTEAHRLEGDEVVETWATFDMLGLFQQLGAVELPR